MSNSESSVIVLNYLAITINSLSTLLLFFLLLYILIRKREEMKRKFSYSLISMELATVMFVNGVNILTTFGLNQTYCRYSVLFSIYFRNASSIWAGIICFILNGMIVKGKTKKYKDLSSYYLVAFGIPIIPVIIYCLEYWDSVTIGAQLPGQNQCVIDSDQSKKFFCLCYVIPIIVSVITVCIYLLNRYHLYSLYRDRIITREIRQRVQNATRILIGYPMCNFAVSMIAAIQFYVSSDTVSGSNLTIEYIFTIILASQGTIDFFIYFFQSKTLYRDVTDLLGNIKIRSMSVVERISTWYSNDGLKLTSRRTQKNNSYNIDNPLITQHQSPNSVDQNYHNDDGTFPSINTDFNFDSSLQLPNSNVNASIRSNVTFSITMDSKVSTASSMGDNIPTNSQL